MASEVVEHDDIAALECRHQELLDIGSEALAIDRAVENAGASIRSMRKAARKVIVRQWPWGAEATRRWSRRARPCVRVMLVLTQVSSMKTSRLGSTLA